jgi:hypothetical protein
MPDGGLHWDRADHAGRRLEAARVRGCEPADLARRVEVPERGWRVFNDCLAAPRAVESWEKIGSSFEEVIAMMRARADREMSGGEDES